VPERVPRPQQVEQVAVVGDVNATTMDDAQKRDRAAVLGKDHRSGKVELDRRLRGDFGQLLGREPIERRPLCEKPRDFAQAGVQLGLR
jgi:hypothetical protein